MKRHQLHEALSPTFAGHGLDVKHDAGLLQYLSLNLFKVHAQQVQAGALCEASQQWRLVYVPSPRKSVSAGIKLTVHFLAIG